MPPTVHILLDLPGFNILDVIGNNHLTVKVEYEGKVACPSCSGTKLRVKDSFTRVIKHVLFGLRPSNIEVKANKYLCRDCGKYFNSRYPGIKPRKRATEPCRNEVTALHNNGWTQRSLSKHLGLGSATVERWYQDHFKIKNHEYKNAHCPKVMGIDEHFFTKKQGFATTIADLTRRKVFEVALGRSELTLRSFCRNLLGRDQVRVVLMDLSETYRAIAKKYFPNALIVADRFHVIRLVNHHFIRTWAELDEAGRKSRGLTSLMRRHPDRMREDQRINLHKYLNGIPGLMNLYIVWQDFLRLLRMSRLNKWQCKKILGEYLWIIEELKKIPFKNLQI